MKIAIVHDDLMRKGGAEQVFLSMLKAFPYAKAFTLCYNPKLTYSAFADYHIKTSWFQNVAKTEKEMKMLFFPLGIWAMKSLDLSSFDVILISTTFCGKYIKTKPGTTIITYCHTPFRLAWYPDSYEFYKSSRIKRFAVSGFTKLLQRIDKKYALKSDFFIANSNEVVQRIRDCYTQTKPISVINPPVNLDNFYISEGPKDYYLIVSRFQPYKKVDLVIEAFNEMPDKKLVVVGTGLLEARLKDVAKENVEFKGVVNSEELASLYSNCKALVFPQYEDYGITPLEANASGRPVIAFGAGGVLETMIPFENNAKPFSAVFFQKQEVEDLKKAIKKFESLEYLIDPNYNKANAGRFSEKRFIERLQGFVKSLNNKQNHFHV